MAATASSKSEEVRMWSGYGQNLMEIDGMFDLGFVLIPPDQLALEEITSSTNGTPATAPPLQPSAECLVSSMPTVVSSSTDVCPVCMEELIHHHFQSSPSSSAAAEAAEATEDQGKEEGKGRSGTAKQMPCGHIFHFSCISAWLSLHRTCPLCRHLLPN